ncbi:hypothetical protein FQR65_LT03941 [Abscondita terminalis]|nr:hypothetical protein FQR65_LT03941 [Abscondita terminalis]
MKIASVIICCVVIYFYQGGVAFEAENDTNSEDCLENSVTDDEVDLEEINPSSLLTANRALIIILAFAALFAIVHYVWNNYRSLHVVT